MRRWRIKTQRGTATWCAVCSEVGFGSLTEEEKVCPDALGGTAQEMLTSPEVTATSKNRTSFSHEDHDLTEAKCFDPQGAGSKAEPGLKLKIFQQWYSMALSWCSASDKGFITYQLGNFIIFMPLLLDS